MNETNVGALMLNEARTLLTTQQKALTINLDEPKYGTFAEIGAGQEVAREFFHAGGASGTVAKSISAYDMVFSDAIYGKAPRYVSRQRLNLMLEHEYSLLQERLGEKRGSRTVFFVFANTVTTGSHRATHEAHGWVGVRFQLEPGREPSEIVLHVRMWDTESGLQQQALGIVGVNLLYGAFYYHRDPKQLIESLRDNVALPRIEVDMLHMQGPAFSEVDNRLMALHLVECSLTSVVMFGDQCDVMQPSEVLHKKAILVERGSFRPVTHVNVDMINSAAAQFVQEPLLEGKEVAVLMEITMKNLLSSGKLDPEDFLSRVDLLTGIGFTVLISNYAEYYRLTSYFRRYTQEMIGVALGINNLLEILNEKYYENLDGGILEAFGRLFRNAVKLYVYPMSQSAYVRYQADSATTGSRGQTPGAHVLISARNVRVAEHLEGLYAYLVQNHYVDCITGYNPAILHVFSRDVLRMIRSGDADWEAMVPSSVAISIKAKQLFGFLQTRNVGFAGEIV